MNIIIFRPYRRSQSVAHTTALYFLNNKNAPRTLRELSITLGIPYIALKGVILKYIKIGKAFTRVGRAMYRLTAAQAAFLKKFNSVVDADKLSK